MGETFEMSRWLAQRAAAIRELSREDREQLHLLLLDYFAASYAGYRQNAPFNRGVEAVVFARGGREESTVLFHRGKVPAETAAFLNAAYAHGAELDDGNKLAMGHVGTHVIPAVLALAESEGKSREEVLLAITAGYEAFVRISAAAQPGMVQRSFHSSGMAGAPASAVACAKLLGLDAEGIENAMSLACTMASGLLTYSESRQMVKPINPARAAQTGVFAARLAQQGVPGPLNCLEGVNGWFRAVTDRVNEELFTRESPRGYLIHDGYIKLYPSCRHTHCGIEAAIALHERAGGEKIRRVEVHIYPNAIRLAGIRYPKDADETKFSVPYTLACGLAYGAYGVDYMDPPRMTEEITALIDSMELIPDETLEDRERAIRGTRVCLELESGERLEETVLVPKGDPEKPLGRRDVEAKLRSCAGGLVSGTYLAELVETVTAFGGEGPLEPEKLFAGREES